MPSPHRTLRWLFLLPVLAAAACAASRPRAEEASAAVPPLESFAAMKLVVMPTQRVRPADSSASEAKALTSLLDSAIVLAFRNRGLSWAFPPDLARTARRNPTIVADPATIRAGDAVRQMERRSDAVIPEPVGTQLRALSGFHDARYVLVPVEVRFETPPAGRVAVLHAAILDVRGARLVWMGDVSGSAASTLKTSVAVDLAERFATLFVAR